MTGWQDTGIRVKLKGKKGGRLTCLPSADAESASHFTRKSRHFN